MNFLTVPARNDLPWYRFTATVSGVVYTFRFRYNTRMQRWIMDLLDASGNDIQLGIPVLLERDLVGQYVTAELPPGTFFAMDRTNQGSEPTRFSFGITHELLYADPST